MSGGRARRDPLSSYRAKRDFSHTPEPAGAGAVAGEQPRYVIHEHSARRLHWDLRLEHDGVLVSWALPKGMPLEPKVNHIAPHTEDHPLEYLDFEADIPAGSYGAGTMRIWDRGTYDCLKWEPRKIEVALHGERLNARYALFAIGEDGRDWMIHRMDPADGGPVQAMPQRVMPMLARAGALPRDESAYAFEIKWDGLRAIAYSSPGALRFESRNLNDIGASYPELMRLGRAFGSHSAVLDGEIVVLDGDGRPSFAALARRMGVSSPARAKRLAEREPVTYVIFDLLWLDGESMMALPYTERREALAALSLRGERWHTPDYIAGHGRETLAESERQGLEGVIAKRLDSPYEPGRRSGAWIKLKNVRLERLAVGGWLAGQGRRRERIGALLVGERLGDGTLRYAGRVGSGMGEEELEALATALAPLERRDSPFAPDGAAKPPRGANFVEPALEVEVAFREWTEDGVLRQPSFKRLVTELAPVDSAIEIGAAAPNGRATARVDGRELVLSNLDKVLYPRTGFTKGQVIDYYARIAAVLLPHLRGRALTVVRFPDGVDGKAFFQKQSPAHRPAWVATATIASRRGEKRESIDYTLVEDRATLVWLANLAALELHTPMARAADIGVPTAVVFDLDPGPPAGVLECCRVALWLQGMFERIGLASFAKTSGSKGLQVYVPLNSPDATHEQTKSFARAVALAVEQAEPALAVSRMTKTLRAGKVLIDWSQNDGKKTTVSVYSLRARERPAVSAPLEWAEVRAALDSADDGALQFDSDAVLARVRERGDLFASVLSLVQALPAL
ncbi:MAG TPA: DNA ligase D [Solirubrobacteraceae bacterium]|nr:DNA ligase D [Solirubrobacteraceae bacterium]